MCVHLAQPLAETDLRCALCLSSAGSHPSLEKMCSGLAGCDGLRRHFPKLAAEKAGTESNVAKAESEKPSFPTEEIGEM